MYRPVPRGFPEAFVELGWGGIEEHFHAHSRSIRRWLDVCGRDELRARRAEYVRRQREAKKGKA